MSFLDCPSGDTNGISMSTLLCSEREMDVNLRGPLMSKSMVLFLCTGNSARSQMAEAFLRQHAGDQYDVHSAGLNPREFIH
ncbi:Arsenate-mycothiol transferase ArsC1 [Gimesia fumaroli]|uniref:Arsenate-mycothiol transferase ArsC1 n=2 Tax=Gimesia fumaroli TaxID=2527976 RepID=A0A518IGR2_9PLAN|nr:Arsenate-mycothiol transferase ArsC1 [Gimesia fumaroli]